MQDLSHSEGSIYFRKDRKKWITQYYEYDIMKGKSVKKNRSFSTKEDAQKFLDTIMYQRENPIYIEKNGLPLYDLMIANLNNRRDANLISDAQYQRVLRSINVIAKAPFIYKNIGYI